MRKTKIDILKTVLFLIGLNLMLVCSCRSSEGGPVVNPDEDGDPEVGPVVEFWMTRGNKSALFEKQDVDLAFSTADPLAEVTIDIDSTVSYQEIDGFGFALTGGSAQMINQMSDQKKDDLLKELFTTDGNSIGVSYIRISLGASDLSAEPFTYDETPDGEPDLNLEYFSIEREEADLIPVLKRVIELNPDIKILASPWTAPTWMKSNGAFVGGELLKVYYDVYSRYMVEYIKAMENEGIRINALTPQNEPLYGGNNPSMLMSAADQADFIKNYLGPQFEANNISTKIIIYDHNLDRTDYPLSILADEEAAKYVDGSGFHLYGGSISSMGTMHQLYPDKNLYFTEQWTSSGGDFAADLKWHVGTLIIGATRNWSRNVIEWNLASDANYGPHTDGGCNQCQGALTISGNSVVRNVSYYVIAHASKFARPGSVRIASDSGSDLQTVAFKTPDGKKVLVVLNSGSAISTKFNIRFNGMTFTSSLWAGAAGTYIWK